MAFIFVVTNQVIIAGACNLSEKKNETFVFTDALLTSVFGSVFKKQSFVFVLLPMPEFFSPFLFFLSGIHASSSGLVQGP